jgi:hypothetical protein
MTARTTISTADELDEHLAGWRQMAANTLRADGLSERHVAALSASPLMRRILRAGNRLKDRDTGEMHTLTSEGWAAVQLLGQVEAIKKRLSEQRQGAPVTLQEGVVGGIQLMMLREAIFTSRWLAEPARAVGKRGGRPTSAATRLIKALAAQFPTFKRAQSVLPTRERAPKAWQDFTVELDSVGRYVVTHPVAGKSRTTISSLGSGFSRIKANASR